MIRIGVDTGGTFTDLVLLDERGLRVHKVRSTPDDPARAILAGIAELAGGAAVDEVLHGSTVATNAVLERKGARVGLIATRGFEDVLRIGRQTRAKLYDFQVEAARPIVDPELVVGVRERMDHHGNVLEALDAAEAVSVERGHDPRGFALVAFGGAGGMHACELAASLEMETVLMPHHAGVLSALGMMLADARKDYSRTLLRAADTMEADELERVFAPMVAQAMGDLALEGFAAGDVTIERSLDVRYRGQAYEISVPLTTNFISAFHEQHYALYGYSNRTRPTEVVNLRVQAAGRTRKYDLGSRETPTRALPKPLGTTRARFDGAWHETPVYAQSALLPGCAGEGPVIVAGGGEATTVIPPAFAFRVDGVGTIVATAKRGAR